MNLLLNLQKNRENTKEDDECDFIQNKKYGPLI